MKKFELTTESIFVDGRKLYRIRAVKDFGDVKKGDLGGFVETEDNLSQTDDAWVYGKAMVYGEARVCGKAEVYGEAEVCGGAEVCGEAMVYGKAMVYGEAGVCGKARICESNDYATVIGFGSQLRTTTFFRQKDNSLGVKCDCFSGTMEEFKDKVTEIHGDNKYAKEYLMIAALMELHFKEEG